MDKHTLKYILSHDELLYIYSDLHKDARGFRPTQDQWTWVRALTSDQLQRHCDSLQQDIEELNDWEAEVSNDNYIRLKNLISSLVNHAVTRSDVLRWMAEHYECGVGGFYDWNHFAYLEGIHCNKHRNQLLDWAGIKY
jgi:hypothetical protein